MSKINFYISGVLVSPEKRMARHCLLQLLLIAITSSVLWTPGSTALPNVNLFLIWGVYYLIVNILVYMNIYILAKKLLLNNRFDRYILSVAGLICVLILTIGLLQSFLPDEAGTTNSAHLIIGIVSSMAAVGLLFAGTSALVLFRQWIVAGQKRTELESLTLGAELQMLKNQINPHFLFNMLNNCYLLVRKGRQEASDILFRLEKLLRYQIASVSDEKVSLKAEITFLGDLLTLEKVRRDSFNFSIRDNIGEKQIFLPPMVLIPFVENAIKHNVDSENDSYVELLFENWEKGIVFTCINSKPSKEVRIRAEGGLGLKNITRRLELLFPQKHIINIEEQHSKYSVKLRLEL